MGKNIKLYKLILAGIFSALTFVGTLINVPLPSGGLVHLGNFVMVIAALLCGGLIGGISGSLGMGIYDIVAGYHLSSILRSFILKFIIGFIVGYTFRLIIKRKLNVNILTYVFTGIFLIVSVIFTIMCANMQNNQFIVDLFGATKAIKNTDLIMATVFAYLFFIGFLLVSIFINKLKYGMKVSVFSITIGMLINMVLELILRTLLTHFIDGTLFDVAFVTAVAKIPASILTSFITVIFGAIIYKFSYNATKEINHLNDVEVDV